MNRKFLTCAVALTALIFSVSCSSKKDENHDHDATDVAAEGDVWQEMDEFHTVMAEAFHPYKDSANLEPAKANAEEMAAVAGKWAHADLPDKVDNDKVKEKLQKLKSDSEAFAQTVKSGDEKAISESLTQLHDLFHEIQESWYDAEGHGHHH